MLKLLMGGSPCTHWSIAQTKDRETEPSGIGWELFLNYCIARDKYRPDYFIYENNKSMSPAIKAQITRELGVEPVLINSALVSAQSRQRLYWVGKRNPDGTYSRVDVEQPEDRGVLLRDVLESGVCWREKAYTLDANYHKTLGQIGFETQAGRRKMVAEPVRIGTIESTAKNADFDSQQYRVYSPDGKSVTLCGNGGGVGAKTGLYATPVRVANINGGGQGNRIYSTDAKSCAIKAQGGGLGGHGQGLYAVPCAGRIVGRRISEQGHRDDYNENIPHFQYFEINSDPQKTNCLTTVQKDNMVIETWDGKTYPVYEVRNSLITIKDKTYPIKLADGYYIIRKLTVTECKRLQTVPDSYVFPVSDTQAYKMLGNGWTVDVIAHILSHIPDITTEPVEVLGMYDGMSCGHIALDKLGANVERYYATEIDKYAIQTTQHNYPDTVQLGDAFQVREDDWRLPA